MDNMCDVILLVCGPPNVVDVLLFKSICPQVRETAEGHTLHFSLSTLIPCQPSDDPCQVWGCTNDVCDNLFLECREWTSKNSSITLSFQTHNTPPIHWFYKLAECYPQLDLRIIAVNLSLGLSVNVRMFNGSVLCQDIQNNLDFFNESDCENYQSEIDFEQDCPELDNIDWDSIIFEENPVISPDMFSDLEPKVDIKH